MPKTDAERIEELQDHIYALQQLLLTHVLTTDQLDRRVTLDTFKRVRDQIPGLVEQRRDRVAIRLAALIESIEERLD